MRAIIVLCSLSLLAFAFVPAAAAAPTKCVTEKGHSVCVFPDEPSWIECVSVDGKAPVCIVDPCGTTMCF